MEFNTLVKTKLFPILNKYGFEITEEFKNIVHFQSSFLKINVAFNDYDRSNLIEIGKKNEILYPLNDDAIKIVFHSELQIDKVEPEIFIQNLSAIFQQTERVEILNTKIDDIIECIEKQGEDYTFELIQQQKLETASKAWERNDYKGFIKSMDEIDINKVPKSYQLKYNIAKQKI